jgi:hypothetical protein
MQFGLGKAQMNEDKYLPKIDEDGNLHMTREYLLSDLAQLERIYIIFGKEKVINWILRKNIENEKQS